MYKNIFINKYKWFNIVENYANFLKIIKYLKSFVIKFELEKTMKLKIYPNDYIMKSLNQWLIIIIIYNKYLFSINNKIL